MGGSEPPQQPCKQLCFLPQPPAAGVSRPWAVGRLGGGPGCRRRSLVRRRLGWREAQVTAGTKAGAGRERAKRRRTLRRGGPEAGLRRRLGAGRPGSCALDPPGPLLSVVQGAGCQGELSLVSLTPGHAAKLACPEWIGCGVCERKRKFVTGPRVSDVLLFP